MIAAVAVVVPVHDEAQLLPGCLAALDAALCRLPPAIRGVAVVALDACTDDSAAITRRWAGRDRIELALDEHNVGRARALGMQRALAALASVPPDQIWLATTDADSAVPAGWLVDQLALAATGVHGIAGTIYVDDWTDYPLGFAERFARSYAPPGSSDSHVHVHGANLGVRADAYLAAGGFAPLSTGEDHALWHALHAAGHRCLATRTIEVATSGRRTGRAPSGFSQFLRDHSAY